MASDNFPFPSALPVPARQLAHLLQPQGLDSTTLNMATHHIATMLPPAWGHAVSYSHLAVQLLNKDPNLVLTLMQHNIMGE